MRDDFTRKLLRPGRQRYGNPDESGVLSEGQFSKSETLTIPVWELVKLRVSQINQCAFCIDMHSKDALSQGEASERILGLNAWRDMPFYSQIERAALEWAEHLTFGKPVSDDIY